MDRRSITRTILIIGSIFLLVLMTCVSVVSISANVQDETTAHLHKMTPSYVEVTPTADATFAALQKEQLAQQIKSQQHTWGNWGWNLVTTSLGTLALALGGIFAFFRWLGDRRNEQTKRSEERFKSIVDGLESQNNETSIASAILLRTFLHPGYSAFYTQVFDLAVAGLRPHKRDSISISGKSPDSLSQAFIVLFTESFPRARDLLKEQNTRKLLLTSIFMRLCRHSKLARRWLAMVQEKLQFKPQFLDATSVQLDRAFLVGIDLREAWMPDASLRNAKLIMAQLNGITLEDAHLEDADLSKANLSAAKLSGAYLSSANLSTANLKGANLSKAHLNDADLRNANLEGANLSQADLSKAIYNKHTIWPAHNVDLTGALCSNG